MDEVSVWNPRGVFYSWSMSPVQTSSLQLLTSAVLESAPGWQDSGTRPQGSQCRSIWHMTASRRMNEQARESTCGESSHRVAEGGPEFLSGPCPHLRAPAQVACLVAAGVAQCSLLTVRVWSSHPVWPHPCQLQEKWTDCSQDPSCGAGQSWSQQLDSPAHVDGGRRQG